MKFKEDQRGKFDEYVSRIFYLRLYLFPMSRHPFKLVVSVLWLTFYSFLGLAQEVEEPRDTPVEWSKPYPPFRIAGNLYYVGTQDLACYLITTPKGNILINTGLASSVGQLKTNIEALGFKFNALKILLTTQAHYDHMGAMAAVQKITGAKFMIDQGDREVAEDGGRSDYAIGADKSTYRPVKVDRVLHNGDKITLGGTELVMLHHPGHTKGSCSFQFIVKDKKRRYKVLIANMPTIVTDKKFSEISSYPQIAADYAYTIKSMKSLSFDIWLASHASQFELQAKHKPGAPYNPEAFMDHRGYNDSLKKLEEQFLKK